MFWYVMNLSNLTPPVDYFFDNNYPFHWTKNQWLNTKVSHSFYCCYFPKKNRQGLSLFKKRLWQICFRNLVFSHLFLVNDLSNEKNNSTYVQCTYFGKSNVIWKTISASATTIILQCGRFCSPYVQYIAFTAKGFIPAQGSDKKLGEYMNLLYYLDLFWKMLRSNNRTFEIVL